MKAYVVNKILSLSIVFLFLAITYFVFGYSEEQWKVILVGVLIFGYGHYFVGSYYQLMSFKRAIKPQRHYVSFIFLTIFSIAIAYLIFEYLGFIAALFIGLVYFLVHGLFNEQTLLQKQTKQFLPLQYIVALAVFIFSLLVYALPDKSFFFDNNLTFVKVNDLMVNYYFNNFYLDVSYFPIIFWSGIALTLAVLSHAWYKYRYTKTSLFLGGVFGLVTVLVVLFGAPTYIYIYAAVVGYHYLTWLIYYVYEMYKRGKKEFFKFTTINIALIASLIILAGYHFSGSETHASNFFFDYRNFIIFTYIHISTSFMNDEWFKVVEKKLFDRFEQG